MTTINFNPDAAHTYRAFRHIHPDHYEAARAWSQAIHEQDGVLKLANLFSDLQLFAELADDATGGRASSEFLQRLLASFGAAPTGGN